MPLPGSQPPPAGISLRPLRPDSRAPFVAVAVTEAQSVVVLRETAEAVVYAGALTGADGRIIQWLEIWVQRITASPFFHPGGGGPANADGDARWHELRRALTDLGDGRMLTTGDEEVPQLPVWWDHGGRRVLPEGDISPARDDAELTGAGLPAYSSGPHRYLTVRGPEVTAWLPLTPGAPVPRSAAAPPEAALTFNPHGGHLFCRFAAPYQISDYAGALSSGQLPPAGPRLSAVTLQTLRDIRHQPGYFLHSWHGDVPPQAEIFHLKLALLHGMAVAVEAAVRSRRLPLLNLKTRSFGLDWAGDGSGLALWTVQPVLDLPSAATRWMDGGDGDDPVFLLAQEPPASIYRHPDITGPRVIRGNVRFSQLRAVGSQKDHLETEGTLILTEELPRLTDTVLIHSPLAASPIQAGVISVDPNRGEVVFRTGRWRPAPGIAASIAAGGQAPAPMDCDCAIVPRLSAPADLYSLGVIALEILCAGSGQGLPMIVDEALRIARRIGQEKLSLDAVPDTLAGWQRRETGSANWAEVLSPRHLAGPPPDAETATRMVPPVAWFSAITWALRLLTGSFSQAYCQSAGEGSPQSPHLIFEVPLRDLRALLNRTRSLVTMEWKANLDIRDQVLAILQK